MEHETLGGSGTGWSSGPVTAAANMPPLGLQPWPVLGESASHQTGAVAPLGSAPAPSVDMPPPAAARDESVDDLSRRAGQLHVGAPGGAALGVRIMHRGGKNGDDRPVAPVAPTLQPVPDIARRSPAVASTPPAVPKQELSVTLSSALEDNRNRAFIINLERVLASFLLDDARKSHSFASGEYTSFHRFLIHQVAEACGMEHPSIPTAGGRVIVWTKTDATSATWLPTFQAVVAASGVPTSGAGYESSPRRGGSNRGGKAVTIMKRQGGRGAGGGGRGLPPHHASSVSIGALSGELSGPRTLEEREAEYREARARIFDGDTAEDQIPNYPQSAPPKIPRPRAPMSHYGLFLGDSGPWMPSPGQTAAHGGWSTGQPGPESASTMWNSSDSGEYLMRQPQPQTPQMVDGRVYQPGMMMMSPGVDGSNSHWSQNAVHVSQSPSSFHSAQYVGQRAAPSQDSAAFSQVYSPQYSASRDVPYHPPGAPVQPASIDAVSSHSPGISSSGASVSGDALGPYVSTAEASGMYTTVAPPI